MVELFRTKKQSLKIKVTLLLTSRLRFCTSSSVEIRIFVGVDLFVKGYCESVDCSIEMTKLNFTRSKTSEDSNSGQQ